jgi:cytoskeleton-associated protein 5
MLKIMETLCSSEKFNAACVSLIASGAATKLGDTKLKKIAGSCLEQCATRTSLDYVFSFGILISFI